MPRFVVCDLKNGTVFHEFEDVSAEEAKKHAARHMVGDGLPMQEGDFALFEEVKGFGPYDARDLWKACLINEVLAGNRGHSPIG